MNLRNPLILAIGMAAFAGGAAAQPSNAAAASDPVILGPTTVQGLTVMPHPKCLKAESAPAPAPKIVSISPTEGQVVRPGLIAVQITFDRPMTCSGFLTALAKVASPCPPREQTFIQTFDHKTVRTLCLAQPGQTYAVMVGGDCAQPFVSLDDQKAAPLAVHFSTSHGPPVTTVPEALAEEHAGPPPSLPVVRGLVGTWQGEVTDQFGRRPLILHVSADAKGALSASLDLPYRNALHLPVWDFRLDRDKVEFSLPAVDDTYSGTLSVDGSTISGFWSQEHKATNFTYARSKGRPPPPACG